MPKVGINDLLAAGVHFGHQTQRWNPKMKRYIFGERNRVHIINLRRTEQCLNQALDHANQVVKGGKSILFVGTKIQARQIIQEEAGRCGEFFVTERWLGGMLTNFRTIKTSINRLKEIDRGFSSGEYDNRTKKEQIGLRREQERLESTFSGIKEMPNLPGALFVVDTNREKIAVAEANRLNIPVIGIVDTNADPDPIQFPVPGNDDAIRSIRIFSRALADQVIETKGTSKDKAQAAEAAVPPAPPAKASETPVSS